MKCYPPEEYPRLYPRPVEYEYRGQQNFRILNGAITLIGIVLLGFLIEWEIRVEGVQEYSVAIPAFFGILQFVPYVLLEFSGFQQFKLMRKLIPEPCGLLNYNLVDCLTYFTRLDSRDPGHFIWLFVVELTGAYLSMWETKDTIIRSISTLLCNSLFAAIIAWNLHGRKPDPYQATKDRYTNVRAVIKAQLWSVWR